MVISNELISLKEASQISGYHSDYLSFLIRSGKLKGVRVGRAWLVNKEELGAFLKLKENPKLDANQKSCHSLEEGNPELIQSNPSQIKSQFDGASLDSRLHGNDTKKYGNDNTEGSNDRGIDKGNMKVKISQKAFTIFFIVGLILGTLSISFAAKSNSNIFSKLSGNFATAFLAGGSPQTNYQGKLTGTTGIAVSNNTYNIRFKLYATSTGGSPLWTETYCYSPDSGTTCDGTGTNSKVQVTSGLFSTMLGSITSLSGIDFNQVLYLGVEIGSTSSIPAWDGEMTPRKRVGVVPSAFTSNNLNGVSDYQFVRLDTTNATSSTGAVLTLTQNGLGNVVDFYSTTTKVFYITSIGNAYFTNSIIAPNYNGLALATTTNGFTISTTSLALTVTGNASLSGSNTGDITLAGNTIANGLTLSGQALTLGLASGSATGTLSATDWNTFNNKVSNDYASSSFVNFNYASSTFASTSFITANFPTFGYGTSTYLSQLQAAQDYVASTTLTSNYPTFTYATNTYATINNYPTYTYASSTFASTSWVTGTFLPISASTSLAYIPSASSSTFLSTTTASTTYAHLTGAVFTGNISASNLSGVNTGDVTLANNINGLTISNQILTMGLAGTSATGTLSATDWNTFNNKVSNEYASSTFASTTYVVSTYVPYTGATTDVNLNAKVLSNMSTLSVGSATAPTGGVAYFNGNVGIGVESPGTRLEIYGAHNATKGLFYVRSTDHAYFVLDSATGYQTGFTFSHNTSQAFTLYSPANTNDLAIYDNAGGNLARMYFKSGGNVGVGTTSPSAKLDVYGTAGTADIFGISSSSNSRLFTVGYNGSTTIANLNNAGFVKSTASGALYNDTNTYLTGTGAGVTSVSIATANGFSGSSSGGATPALTIIAGAINPTSVNGLTLATSTNGFTIAGGGTSKTLTVPLDASVSGTNTGDQTLAGLGGVAANGAITGATKTKITYDAKGLVTSGADATTADIADSLNKRYVTDAYLTVLGNTTGSNSGDVTLAGNSVANGLTLSGQALTLGLASGSATGTLSATDWTTFNNKQPAGSYLTGTKVDSFNTRTGAVTLSSSDVTTALTFTPYNATNPSSYIALTSLSGTAPITYNTGTGAIGITQAATAANGYLSSTDWNTFNNKLSTASAASTYVPYTGATGGVNLNNQVLNNVSTLSVGSATAPTGGVAYFNGNVGIGTTGPIGKLQLGSNWTANPGSTNTLYLGSAGFVSTNLAPEEIITTNSANTSPGANIGLALHNSNTTAGAFVPMLVFSKTETGATAYNSAVAAIGARTVTGTGTGGNWIDGDMMFYTSPTAGSGLLERMRIQQDGNVGIGMTNPESRLGITASSTIGFTSGTLPPGMTIYGATADGYGSALTFKPGVGDQGVAGIGSFRTSGYQTDLRFYTNNTNAQNAFSERMRITPDGKVGIGTTLPANSLSFGQTNGTIAFWELTTGNALRGIGYNSAQTGVGIWAISGNVAPTNANSSIFIQDAANGNGYVGIGTSTPSGSKLVIVSPNDQAGITMHNTYDNNKWSIRTGTVGINNKGLAFVDDVNAATRIQIDNSGNVGIGTTTPGAKLEVNTTGADSGIWVSAPATNYGYLRTKSGTGYWDIRTDGTATAYTGANDFSIGQNGGASQFLIQNSTGNVGIGTTNPQALLNTYKTPVAGTYVEQLRIGGTGNYASLSLGTYDAYDGFISTFGNDMRILAGKGVATENHNIHFYTSFNGSGGQAENNERMTILSSGNVGIGTASPGYLLDVKAVVPPATDAYAGLNLQAANYGYLIEGGLKQTFGGVLKISQNQNGSIAERMRIDSNGHVGIGTTSPLTLLDVNGNITMRGGTLNLQNNVSTAAEYITYTNAAGTTYAGTNNSAGNALGTGGTPYDYEIAVPAASDINFRIGTGVPTTIKSTGYVGIGTTTPATALSVIGTSTTQGLRITNLANTVLGVDASGNVIATTTSGGASQWTTNGTSVYYNTGNVGIGTTTPSQKFHLSDGTLLVDNPATPTLMGTVDTVDAANVYVSGNYAYVADWTAGAGLKIIDISDPASPTLITTFNVGNIAVDVFVSGKYAYVASYQAGLKIVDISNPYSPVVIGTYDTPSYAFGVYVSGKYAYVADYNSGFHIIDVSNPAAPTLASSYDTPGVALGIYISGKYAYVADSTSGLEIFDISNPVATPTLVGTYGSVANAQRVYVSGKYVYLADANAGLKIINISSPTAPTLSGSYDTASSSVGVYVSGKYAYVADGASGLQIINISSSTAPTLTGSYPSYAAGVFISGKYAYIASGAPGLKIVDVKGADVSTLSAGNISSNDITVSENVDIGNNLYVRSGINVGFSGILSDGNISVSGSSSNYFLGNVGIGITNPTYKLQVNGQPAANGYTAFTNYSDKRLKENITPLAGSYNSLNKIIQLNPVTYNYNKLSGYDDETRSRKISGFIAQELQPLFPEMVGTTTVNGKQYLDTNLSNLSLYIVSAIKEQAKQIGSFVIKIKDGVAYLRNIVTQTLAVGSRKNPAGITMYDDITGNPYCVKIVNGTMVNEDGECGVVLEKFKEKGKSFDYTATVLDTESLLNDATSSVSEVQVFDTDSEGNIKLAEAELQSTSTIQEVQTTSSTSSTSVASSTLTESVSTTIISEEQNQIIDPPQHVLTASSSEEALIVWEVATTTDLATSTISETSAPQVIEELATTTEIISDTPATIEEVATTTEIVNDAPAIIEEVATTTDINTDTGLSSTNEQTGSSGKDNDNDKVKDKKDTPAGDSQLSATVFGAKVSISQGTLLIIVLAIQGIMILGFGLYSLGGGRRRRW